MKSGISAPSLQETTDARNVEETGGVKREQPYIFEGSSKNGYLTFKF